MFFNDNGNYPDFLNSFIINKINVLATIMGHAYMILALIFALVGKSLGTCTFVISLGIVCLSYKDVVLFGVCLFKWVTHTDTTK